MCKRFSVRQSLRPNERCHISPLTGGGSPKRQICLSGSPNSWEDVKGEEWKDTGRRDTVGGGGAAARERKEKSEPLKSDDDDDDDDDDDKDDDEPEGSAFR